MCQITHFYKVGQYGVGRAKVARDVGLQQNNNQEKPNNHLDNLLLKVRGDLKSGGLTLGEDGCPHKSRKKEESCFRRRQCN